MINITVFTGKNSNRYNGIRSEGHAGYGEEGSDIICAAVSVLMINTINSIEAFTDDEFKGEEQDGFLEFYLTEPVSDKAALLLDSLVLGLQHIRKSYGSTFIEITTKEV